VGLLLGADEDGVRDGCILGWSDGRNDGDVVGVSLGVLVMAVGADDCMLVGDIDVGNNGMSVGEVVGAIDGILLGELVGNELGTAVGNSVGTKDGT
jgi:hypothetical protein